MKRNGLLLIFFLISAGVSAGPFDKKMLWGVTASPEYSYRFLRSEPKFDWLADMRDERENPTPAFSTAFHVQLKTWKKIYTDFSFLFVRKGYITEKEELVYNQPEPNAPSTIYSRYTVSFLEFPVNINFHPIDSSGFFISVGAAPVFPIVEKRKSFYGYPDGTSSTESETSADEAGGVSLTGSAGIGYYFSAGKKTFIQVKPFYRCNLTKSNGENVKEYYYSFGLDVGVFLSTK